jgi:hypothetical protein
MPGKSSSRNFQATSLKQEEFAGKVLDFSLPI